MRAVVLEFDLLLEDLLRLLERGDAEEQLLSIDFAAMPASDLKASLTRFRSAAEPFAVKMSQYAMQLVLLYGGFERLVEGLIIGAVSTMNEVIPSTADLPERISENHRRKSLDALRDEIWLGRQKDPRLPVRLIENLHSCESAAGNYRLNAVAYARHGGNFRRKTIDEAFRDIGIDDFLRQVRSSREFKEYVALSGHSAGGLGPEMSAIDDLAERRNEIAHGSAMEILTRQELREYITFFRAINRASYLVLRQHLGRFLVNHHSTRFRGASGVHYNKILQLKLSDFQEGTVLQVGDPLAIEVNAGSSFELGRIETIRTNSGDVSVLRAHGSEEICLGTTCRFPGVRRIFFIERTCPSVSLVDPL